MALLKVVARQTTGASIPAPMGMSTAIRSSHSRDKPRPLVGIDYFINRIDTHTTDRISLEDKREMHKFPARGQPGIEGHRG